MKLAPAPSSGLDFRRVLAQVRDAYLLDRESAGAAHLSNPVAAAAFPFWEERYGASDAAHWDDAVAWIVQEEQNLADERARAPLAETLEAIAQELALDRVRSGEELNALRRLFLWRNHPDRRDPAQRDAATRRVAIANMLFDQAAARLAAGAERPA